MLPPLSRLCAGLWLTACAASAAIFTVTSTDDDGSGSLRQAIIDANNTPAADTIVFDIPGTGVRTIAPVTPLPDITNAVTLDGYSQPGAVTNSLPDDNNAVLLVRLDGVKLTNGLPSALTLRANGNSVRGLVIVRFAQGIGIDNCSGNVIAGNWIGMDVDGIARGMTFDGIAVTCPTFGAAVNNVIGGGSQADRNVISGNRNGISFFPAPAANNRVLGNFIGTDPSGTLPRGNLFSGVSIQSATNIIIGGATPGARNVISGSTSGGGDGVSILGGGGHVIQGNFIGTDVTGFYHLGNGGDGVGAQGAGAISIGGAAAGAGNLICNNGGNGIFLLGCSLSVVEGNIIGTDAIGTRPMGNEQAGVAIQSGGTNAIGGLLQGAANVIQFNGAAGVAVSTGGRNEISGNRISGNDGLGIDLGDEGVTDNDPVDGDTGANELQNYPLLAAAISSNNTTRVSGTLVSLPNLVFRLEFFASPPWDAAGIPEGQWFLGAVTLPTGADGSASYDVVLPSPTPATCLVTATATDPLGNTSEFSGGIPAIVVGTAGASLSIEVNGGLPVIGWPAAAPGYELQSTPSLSPPSWQTITNGIIDAGVRKTYTPTNGPAATNEFFRLRM